MPGKVLLLRLEGHLQAWGTRARWDVRDSQPEPTKSGIIGLLGCALGYPSGDVRLETELEQGLRFGVRIENPGSILRDFQTISGFLPTAGGEYKARGEKRSKSLDKLLNNDNAIPATITSPRFYLEDASFLVALEEKQGGSDLLKKCADAVKNPHWPVYLGRKACIPSRPVFEELNSSYNGIKEALLNHPWNWNGFGDCSRKCPSTDSCLDAYIEDETGDLLRQDVVATNKARAFNFRNVKHIYVEIASLREAG